MAPGRPKNFRPMSGKPEDHRQLAKEALDGIMNASGPRTPARTFMMELLEAFLVVDAQMQEDFNELRERIENSTGISEELKVWLRSCLNRFDISDSQTRMQLDRFISDALTGKPPEARSSHGREGLRVPGGAAVQRPKPSDIRLT